MGIWIVQTLNALSFGMLLFLLCSGLSLIFGLMNILNLAHGSCYLLGAYVGLSVAGATGSYLLALVAGAAASAAMGFAMQRFLLRGLYGKRLLQVLVTIGCMFVIGDGSIVFWGASPTTLAKPRLLEGSFDIGGFVFPTYRLFVICAGLVVAFGLWFFQEKTRWGATIRAAVDDQEIARAVGINVPLLLTLVFVLGTSLTGLAGVLGGPFVGMHPGLDLEVLLFSVVVVIVGGLGSMKGAFVGSLLVGFLDTFGKALFPQFAHFTIFAPLVAILAIKPQGLWGKA